jgi:glycosyltransferase involved in cell wall biosynthesis
MGVEIDLVTYGEGQDVDLPGVRIHRIPRLRSLGPVPVGPSWVKLFLDGFVVAKTLALLARNRYHFVHAHEESVFFCRFLKPLFGFKLVYDMHSSLPQQLTNFRFTRSRVLIGMFRKLEDASLTRADAVITICPELATYALSRLEDGRRHLLIENSIFDDVRLRNGGPTAHDGAETWLPRIPAGRQVVAYAGTFEPYQGLDVLLDAFAEVRRERPDVFLLMIGGAAEQVGQLALRAARLGVGSDVLFTGRVEQRTARRLLERADVLTSPRSSGTNTPLKVYEQLASGKPLVATRILSHTQVLDDSVCYLAEPEAPALARALAAALEPDERRRSVVRAARELYDRAYSRQAYEKKIRTLLEILS